MVGSFFSRQGPEWPRPMVARCLESLQDQDQWWLSGIHRPVELHFVARIVSAGAGPHEGTLGAKM